MNTILWILIGLSLLISVVGESSKKNVLFIISDDMRPDLGCYGEDESNTFVTPNIDQLATLSVRFTNAYVQQAVCGPSRTSFFTGRRPDTTRLYDFNSYWRWMAGNFTSLPQHFKDSGYFTASMGKVFNPGPACNYNDDMPYSWSITPYHPSTQQYHMDKVCPGDDGQQYFNLVCPVTVKEQPEGSLPDIQTTEYALNLLKNLSLRSRSHPEGGDPQQPFFMAVGYHKPHVSLKYPKEFRDLYPLDKVSLAPNRKLPAKMPHVAWEPWIQIRRRDDVLALNVSYPWGPMPDDFQRLIRQSYYSSISYIDGEIGKLLSALDNYGFANDTVVVMFGDHGWALGEHQEFEKYSNFDVTTRTPLIVYVPGLTDGNSTAKPGRRFPYLDPLKSGSVSEGQKRSPLSKSGGGGGYSSDSFVELVDLFPTLSDFCGLKVPPVCPEDSSKVLLCSEGISMKPLVENTVRGRDKGVAPFEWKTAAFSQYPRPSDEPQLNSDLPDLKDITIMGYTMRSALYRYTEWVGFDPHLFYANWSDVHARELYVMKSDPQQNENVADDPSFASTVAELSGLLKKGWREALPSKF